MQKERLTARNEAGTVCFLKDRCLIETVNMSGPDIKKAMDRLAVLEDEQAYVEELKERAKPEKPVFVRIMGVDYPQCPECGRTLWQKERFCSNCGKAVKLNGEK